MTGDLSFEHTKVPLFDSILRDPWFTGTPIPALPVISTPFIAQPPLGSSAHLIFNGAVPRLPAIGGKTFTKAVSITTAFRVPEYPSTW